MRARYQFLICFPYREKKSKPDIWPSVFSRTHLAAKQNSLFFIPLSAVCRMTCCYFQSEGKSYLKYNIIQLISYCTKLFQRTYLMNLPALLLQNTNYNNPVKPFFFFFFTLLSSTCVSSFIHLENCCPLHMIALVTLLRRIEGWSRLGVGLHGISAR